MSTIIPPLSERLPQDNKTTITLKQYLEILNNEGAFVIPDYQRGYVWGQKKKNKKDAVDSVTYLIKTLKNAFDEKDVFLQGITVHEVNDSYDIVLVDGQQRTTFFYLLLKYLGYGNHLRIRYDIRMQSNSFLENLDLNNVSRDEDEEFQDIFFFKRTIRYFENELGGYDKDKFLSFILEKVKFLFIVIPAPQAKIVFSMMNGNKAEMKQEELIKAELLRCASLKHELIYEGEHFELRGRLAREWDSWLHWWNDEKVKSFFRTEGMQLGWLLPLILKSSKPSFEKFRERLLKDQNMKQSKEIFKKMRLLQKSIEDRYNDSKSYNYLGVILYIRNSAELRFSFMRWFFAVDEDKLHTRSDEELERYYKWSILNVNHEDIVANDLSKYEDARLAFKKQLETNLLFIENYDTAYKWLIYQNIREDNRFQGRKFDFNIEKNRSIEHIYPKSKIGHKNDAGVPLDWEDKPIEQKQIANIKLWREDMKWEDKKEHKTYQGSEHCIGNLVLLYKRDNSKFNDADFRRKNEIFFTEQDDEEFRSRHLIHTTMIFSDVNWYDKETKEPWNKEQVPMRKHKEISEFEIEFPKI